MGQLRAWSDLHLDHVNMATKYRKVPGLDGTVEGHNRLLIDRWNDTTEDDDVTLLCGDAAMALIEVSVPKVAELKGEIHLFLGNHDRPHPLWSKKSKYQEWIALYDEYFDVVHRDLIVSGAMYGLGDDVIISHFPWHGTPDHEDSDRDHLSKFYPRQEDFIAGTVLIHGHTHSAERISRNAVHVGVDAWHDGPLSESDIRSSIVAARVWI